jgi:hypothetical protein
MKTVEFTSELLDNRITVPSDVQNALINVKGSVRVIVIVDDADSLNDSIYRRETAKQFLNGYAESDSIYDNA